MPAAVSTGGKDFRKHLNEVRAARNMPTAVSPSGSRPTSPSWAQSSISRVFSPRHRDASGKDVEACLNTPRGAAGTSAAPAAAPTGVTGVTLKKGSRPLSAAGSGVLNDTLQHTCPDGHAAALEGHHAPQMADGLYMEEDGEDHMLEFKETPSEVRGLGYQGCGCWWPETDDSWPSLVRRSVSLAASTLTPAKHHG